MTERYLDDLWAQRALESLKGSFDASPELKCDFVKFLFAEGFYDEAKLSFENALTRFNGCMNPAKSEFFKLAEVWALMKRFGRHELFLAMASDLGYEVRRRPTEERKQELLERIAVATERYSDELTSLRGALERIDGEGQSDRIHPAIRDGSRQFCKPGTF